MATSAAVLQDKSKSELIETVQRGQARMARMKDGLETGVKRAVSTGISVGGAAAAAIYRNSEPGGRKQWIEDFDNSVVASVVGTALAASGQLGKKTSLYLNDAARGIGCEAAVRWGDDYAAKMRAKP